MVHNDLKNIFLYHVNESDEIVLNGNIVKERNARIPHNWECKKSGLRVVFCDGNYNEALGSGMGDALDSLLLNVDDIRGKNDELCCHLYGAKKQVRVAVH